MVKVKIVNTGRRPHRLMPAQSAGMDLRATSSSRSERQLIPTGLVHSSPDGFEAQVCPRSGLALKHGVTVLMPPGTIDADYRGELKVLAELL